MKRFNLSRWALVAVSAIGVTSASAGGPASCRPTSQSYASDIQLVSCCDEPACAAPCDEDTCAPDCCVPEADCCAPAEECCDAGGCDVDACDGGGCDGCGAEKEEGKFLFFDGLKGIEFGGDCCNDPWMTLSAGGALRYRFYNEDNRLRPPGPGNDRQSNYSQWRFTPYVTANIKNRVKLHFEGIDAATFGNEIGQLPIDENRWDLLEFYADVKVAETDRGTLGIKAGRQRLLYGDQHVVSPLAWANTFRNFQGTKVYWKGENWDIDGLINMESVNGPAGAPFRPINADQPDQSRSLNGIYSTYRGLDVGNLDLYWLWSREDEPAANRTDGNRHTFGARWYGAKPIKECDDVVRTWKYDVQGAYQVGDDVVGINNGGAENDVEAGFFNASLSHTWNKATWTPTVTGLFYYGSGDGDLANGANDTLYTLYPLGHAYWGLADNFSGQNLIDYSLAISAKPTKKLTLLAAMHWFQKAEEADAIYNIANVALRSPGGTTAGTASRNIGQELDLVATYALRKNVTLQAGYFWFWYGDAVDQATGGVPNDDSDTFYFLANWVF